MPTMGSTLKNRNEAAHRMYMQPDLDCQETQIVGDLNAKT